MLPLQIVLLVGLLLLAALFAASEAALFSISKVQVRMMKERHRRNSERAKNLIQDPDGLLLTVLIGTEMSNIGIASLVANWVQSNWVIYRPLLNESHAWLSAIDDVTGMTLTTVLVSTPILLLFCELIPKVIGARLNTTIVPIAVPFIYGAYRVIAPIRRLQKILFRRKSTQNRSDQYGEADFVAFVEESQKSGTIQKTELLQIKNILDLNDVRIIELATPLWKAFTVREDQTLEQVYESLILNSYSRIPVVSNQGPHEVVGVLYKKDVILHNGPQSMKVHDLMRNTFTVPANRVVSDVFRKMKQQRHHMVFVMDANQSIYGFVTMSDVLGEIFDETPISSLI